MENSSIAIRMHATGDVDVMCLGTVDLPTPRRGEVQVRNEACGVNFIDIYQRRGMYPLELPTTLGNEAAGVVVQMGEGVTELVTGQRVAYCTAGHGCYASYRNVPESKIIVLPDSITTTQAAGCMLKGLTAEYLARRIWPILADMPVLVLAAAGGVGTILCQWLQRLGARVIGVVGSVDKRQRAEANGCDTVLVGYADLASRVRTEVAAGVAVVFDSVGADTWQGSLNCLAPRGCLVSYGNSSGAVPPFALLELAGRGSLYVTRPMLAHYTATAGQLHAAATALFEEVARGLCLPEVTVMPLADVGVAHGLLEARQVKGVLVLETHC